MDKSWLSRSDSKSPSPDVSRSLAKAQERRRKQEQSKLDDLRVDELRPSFVTQVRAHYGEEIYQRMRGWNSGVIEMTIERCERGDINEVIEEMNLTKIPDELIKIPDEVVNRLEKINEERKGNFEEQMKKRVQDLWQYDWNNKWAIRLVMPQVLDQCKEKAEAAERRQRLNDLVNRGHEIADDQMRQLVDSARLRIDGRE